jgi:hypothetical protein
MSAWARAVITILIAIIIAFGLLLFLPDAANEPKQSTHPQLPCVTQETKDHIMTIVIQAFDDALETHMEHLFAVFLQDASPEPSRAQRGTQNGINAWVRARNLAYKWNPVICPPGTSQ